MNADRHHPPQTLLRNLLHALPELLRCEILELRYIHMDPCVGFNDCYV